MEFCVKTVPCFQLYNKNGISLWLQHRLSHWASSPASALLLRGHGCCQYHDTQTPPPSQLRSPLRPRARRGGGCEQQNRRRREGVHEGILSSLPVRYLCNYTGFVCASIWPPWRSAGGSCSSDTPRLETEPHLKMFLMPGRSHRQNPSSGSHAQCLREEKNNKIYLNTSKHTEIHYCIRASDEPT